MVEDLWSTAEAQAACDLGFTQEFVKKAIKSGLEVSLMGTDHYLHTFSALSYISNGSSVYVVCLLILAQIRAQKCP